MDVVWEKWEWETVQLGSHVRKKMIIEMEREREREIAACP